MTLSIITINYNNRAGLQRTIDSVVCQTWKDYEWIVIDGGSTDGSKELIEQYQDHFAYWCSEPDNGIYNAMNKGIAKAQGEYLIFMNSGDAFYDQDVLKKVVDLHSEADIITGQVERMDNHLLLQEYDVDLLMQLYKSTLNHQGTFIRRHLLEKYPYDEKLKVVSDWKFWLDAIYRENTKVEVVDLKIALQDMTGISSGAISSYSVESQNEERRSVLNQYFPSLLQQVLDNYSRLQRNPYVIYGEKLEQRSRVLYAIGWRLLRLLSKIPF